MIQFQCRDCEYATEDSDLAEDHEAETGHECTEREVRPLVDDDEG